MSQKEKINLFLRRNPRVVELISVGIMAVFFFIAFYYIIKNNNPFIFLLSFLILTSVVFIFYVLAKDKFVKRFLLKCSIFPIGIIIITIIVLAGFNFSEGKIDNTSPYKVKFDLYILDNSTSLETFNDNLQKANKIWGNYNISLVLRDIYFINSGLDNESKHFLLNNNATESDCLVYNQIINSFSGNSDKLKVIIISSKTEAKGRACICGCSSIVLEPNKELLFDLTSWNLAHEFGHIFGLPDRRNRWNLMCDEFKVIKPQFLNKEQYSIISNKLDSFSPQP